ncbi:MAG: hypothetical protein GY874_22255 [Desulfobacteraceae bacterium]|nr:hypothetical protein [Desulfobacteraceae bacterium]
MIAHAQQLIERRREEARDPTCVSKFPYHIDHTSAASADGSESDIPSHDSDSGSSKSDGSENSSDSDGSNSSSSSEGSGSSLNSSASNVDETPAVLNNSDTSSFSESSQATVDNIEETSGEVLGYATNPAFSNISFVVDALNSGMEFGHPSADSIVRSFVILRSLYYFLKKFYKSF